MILYIFNNPFPSTGGFSKRCKKEIEILSETNELVIICRANKKSDEGNYLKTKYKNIPIYRFKTSIGITDKVLNYKNLAGFYEAIRNLDLLFGLYITLITVLWKYKQNSIRLYAIVSPLTVPMIAFFSGFLFKVKAEVIEFHDLEPELAMHIKKLNMNSFVMKVELLLEKISCLIYKKVIVTSSSQAKRIIGRTGIKASKIFILPNSIQVETSKHMVNKSQLLRIGYISSFSYEYNITGLIQLIKYVSKNKEDFVDIEILVIGEGELLPMAISETKEWNVDIIFKFIGKQENISKIMKSIDIGIIPWEKDVMTETILPTKLFEYMQAKKTIIAPNFGEFNHILSHNEDALLYNSIKELFLFINTLKLNKNLLDKLATNALISFKNKYKIEIYRQKLLDFVGV
ncbi:MAG TPA: glycosyltransferase [Candidatus Woesebacteria bacterium]|nr:glycosyltransferase [Candidatus Woesebacteria bacterium]